MCVCGQTGSNADDESAQRSDIEVGDDASAERCEQAPTNPSSSAGNSPSKLDSEAASDGATRPSEGGTFQVQGVSSGSASGHAFPIKAPPPEPTMRTKILALKEEQRKLRAENKIKTKEIRNAQRRSNRLKSKVGSLTDDDLNEVLRMRAEAKAQALALVRPNTKASAKDMRSPQTSLKRSSSFISEESQI